MYKNLYTFGIFMLALAIACPLLQYITWFQPGLPFFTLHSYIIWFVVTNIVSIIAVVCLLKYYQYKGFSFALCTGIVAVIAHLFFTIVTYSFFVSRDFANAYIPAELIYIITTIIYAASLIGGSAGKKFWLKTAGIYAVIIGVLFLSIYILMVYVHPSPINTVLGAKVMQWVSVAGSLSPIFFILNFLDELKLLKATKTDLPAGTFVKEVLSATALIAFIASLTIAVMLISDFNSQLYWAKKNFEATKKWVQIFEPHQFVNSKGAALRYRLLKPINYDPQKSYPLVVSLPYGGQPGTDTIKQVEGAAAAELLSDDYYRTKYPAFIFVPNCPPGSGWGGIPNYTSVDTLVYEAIEALDKKFPIDVKRQYVTGISRGAYGSWKFIITRPDLFAAAIPVSGAGDPKLAAKIVDIPVWAFHVQRMRMYPLKVRARWLMPLKRRAEIQNIPSILMKGITFGKMLRKRRAYGIGFLHKNASNYIKPRSRLLS